MSTTDRHALSFMLKFFVQQWGADNDACYRQNNQSKINVQLLSLDSKDFMTHKLDKSIPSYVTTTTKNNYN